MSTIQLDGNAETLAILADAVTRPVPRRRPKVKRHRCCACGKTFFRSRLSVHRCPHCHSDVLVEVAS